MAVLIGLRKPPFNSAWRPQRDPPEDQKNDKLDLSPFLDPVPVSGQELYKIFDFRFLLVLQMIAIILSVVSACILLGEFWTGIAVIAVYGDRLYLERSRNPGPYWLVMMLHIAICVGLPALAFAAGI